MREKVEIAAEMETETNKQTNGRIAFRNCPKSIKVQKLIKVKYQ